MSEWSGILTLAAVMAVLPAAFTPAPPDSASSQAAPGSLQLQRPPDVIVAVGGLSCPFCAYGIEKKFVEREGVDSVFVELEENEVHLWLEPGRELPDEAVRRTVRDAGFTPGPIRRPREGDAGGR